jgi:tetratricopeptide (TPR) repeat protein
MRWTNLALCFEAMGDAAKAIKAINKALELDSGNINYLFYLADLYQQLSNKVRVEEVLEKVLNIDPMNKVAQERLKRLRI